MTGVDLSARGLDVAPTLLGAMLTSTLGGARVRVRITEVEAYEGADDPASHAYRGPTARNAVMFGPPRSVYVYRHMGLHYCMNLTCGTEGTATAVLIRAGEVVDGEETAWQRRNATGVCRTPRDLARGPARLTVALAVTGQHNGIDINAGDGLSLEAPRSRPSMRRGRSEEHTSELQSRGHLVCRLLPEKKKTPSPTETRRDR